MRRSVREVLSQAFCDAAMSRANAELAGNWAAARVLLGMQAVIGYTEGLIRGDLDAEEYLRRVRALLKEAEQYQARA